MLGRILRRGGWWAQRREAAFHAERLTQASKEREQSRAKEGKLVCSQVLGTD